jgi:hypothetical protein
MKKNWALLLLVFYAVTSVKSAYSQQLDTLGIYTSCATALPVCGELLVYEAFADSNSCIAALKPQYFGYMMTAANTIYLNSFGHTGNYILYGPLSSPGIASCDQIALGQVDTIKGILSGTNYIPVSVPGFYILKVTVNNCLTNGVIYGAKISTIKPDAGCCYTTEDCRTTTDCIDCINSFSPTPGKYVFSAWTKGDVGNINSTYTNPGVEISYVGDAATFNFSPSGNIIDGWQRIDGEFDVPVGATDIKITFKCTSGDCYFDDVRCIPFDGKMVSYVYDPISFKMVAELDERNYATIYEYDEQGKLIRLKKETERGIMTIKENRENLHK